MDFVKRKKMFFTWVCLVFQRGEVLFKSGAVTAWIWYAMSNEVIFLTDERERSCEFYIQLSLLW